jgi:hypothetical protein
MLLLAWKLAEYGNVENMRFLAAAVKDLLYHPDLKKRKKKIRTRRQNRGKMERS